MRLKAKKNVIDIYRKAVVVETFFLINKRTLKFLGRSFDI